MTSPADISLLVSDVDGTLVTNDKILTPASIAAVKRLHDAGIGFTVTSSRPPIGLVRLIAALDIRLPVGGFNATDPAPSPDRFLRMVLGRQIHYFIVTNPVLQDRWGHLNDAALIQQWVQRNFTPTMVGRVELYDLTE